MKHELDNIPLREKKFATLKLKILDCFIVKLQENYLADISIKEISKELEISEMTFFNYFKNKKEVLVYYIELWNIEMMLNIKKEQPPSSLESILLIFKLTARLIKDNQRFMMEIIAHMALYGTPKKDIKITRAEVIMRFGSEFSCKEGGFRELVYPLLKESMDNREIAHDDIDSLFIGLHNTFFATPMLVGKSELDKLETIYIEQVYKVLNLKMETV